MRNEWKILSVTAFAAFAGACGANSMAGATASSEAVPAVAATIAVLEAIPPKAEQLGDVYSISCKNKVWDPTPTKENALEILKGKAAAMGANAVVSVTYDDGIVNFITNCWSSITAKAVAIKR